MKAKNTEEYIDHAADFAKPILVALKECVHSTGLPIEEQIKWGFPCFVYKGKVLCHMAAFKQHCSFGFWQARLLSDPYKILQLGEESTNMGQFGKMASLDDIPEASILKQYILEAAQLIDEGKSVKKVARKKPALEMPEAFKSSLEKNTPALDHFNKLSPSHQREYLEYILEAKREETRLKRIDKSISLLLESKSLNDKYRK